MTLRIIPSGATLGARIENLDLSQPLPDDVFEQLLQALGRHGVLSYPKQELTAAQLRAFSARFGRLEVNVAGAYQEPGLPEVMVLSNIVENGKPIGLSDAGQDWHTDMSYSHMIAFTNVLYGMKIPHRDGQPLGNTEFCNMHAACDGLPEEWKQRLDGMTVLHDFDKFWEMMRRERGSTRPPLTPAQRAARPPVSHPLFCGTRSRGGACSMPTPATQCASTRWTSARATRRSSSCSRTRPSPRTATRTAGRSATC
jgi:taurine dioxygenase